jgi:hypothetical protein
MTRRELVETCAGDSHAATRRAARERPDGLSNL